MAATMGDTQALGSLHGTKEDKEAILAMRSKTFLRNLQPRAVTEVRELNEIVISVE